MVQPGGDLHLGKEPLCAEGGGKFRAQHLDGDVAIMPDVVREVDGCHPARTEFPHDAVSVGKCGREAIGGGHGFTLARNS